MDQRLKNITILLLTCWFFYSSSSSKNHRQHMFSSYGDGRFNEVRLKIDQVTANNSQPEVAGELEILQSKLKKQLHYLV